MYADIDEAMAQIHSCMSLEIVKDESDSDIDEPEEGERRRRLRSGILSLTTKDRVYRVEGKSKYRLDVDARRAFRIKVAGACIGNGSSSAEGAIGISYEDARMSNISGRITSPRAMSSQKAELHAIISALEDAYMNVGFLPGSVHVHSDSSYAVMGATVHARVWMRNGYRTTGGSRVVNTVLFMRIHELIWQFDKIGIPVCFEQISKIRNMKARELASKPFASPSIYINRRAWVVAFNDNSFCNDREDFESMDWIRPMPVYSLASDRAVTCAIGVGTVELPVEDVRGQHSLIKINNVLYCPRLPTSLMSSREFVAVGERGIRDNGHVIAWRSAGESWLTVNVSGRYPGYFFPEAPLSQTPALTLSLGIKGDIKLWS